MCALPGLESVDADRSAITFADHVEAICDAVTAAGRPVVLAVHSGAGAPGYAVTDRIPEQIAAMVYVDTGPARGALDPNFDAVEKPMPSLEKLAAEENLDIRAMIGKSFLIVADVLDHVAGNMGDQFPVGLRFSVVLLK